MKIISGKHRGRSLQPPQDRAVRPTSGKAREAVFNILTHTFDALDGAVVLDVFCGTGALAFEALSRGAVRAVLVDNSAEALRLAESNAQRLHEEANIDLIRSNALLIPQARTQCTLAFFDPPYGKNWGGPALAAAIEKGWLAEDAVIVVETGMRDPAIEHADCQSFETRDYGAARIQFLRYAPGKSPCIRRGKPHKSRFMANQKHYPDVNPNPNFPELEEQVLAYWKAQNVFAQSVASRPAKHADGSTNEFIFYDGPPFANGLPHYGHLLTGFVKDAVARYQTMKGKRVERRFGWDCHGLPAGNGGGEGAWHLRPRGDSEIRHRQL